MAPKLIDPLSAPQGSYHAPEAQQIAAGGPPRICHLPGEEMVPANEPEAVNVMTFIKRSTVKPPVASANPPYRP